jgi:hypothetical protein
MSKTDRIFSLGNDSYFADAVTGIGKGLYTGADLLGKGVSGAVGVVQSIPGAVSSAASSLDPSPLFQSKFCRENPHTKGCSSGGKRTRKYRIRRNKTQRKCGKKSRTRRRSRKILK